MRFSKVVNQNVRYKAREGIKPNMRMIHVPTKARLAERVHEHFYVMGSL
jgi:hypothetical protein